MIVRIELLAVLSLAPLAIGPLPTQSGAIDARLCNGGAISIPIKRKGQDTPSPTCFKGCHAGSCRKRGQSSDADAA